MRLQLQSYEASLQEPASLFENIIGASPDTCLAAEYEGAMAAYLLTHPIPDGFENFGNGPAAALGLRNRALPARHVRGHRAQEQGHRPPAVRCAERPSGIREGHEDNGRAVQDSEKFWKKCGFEIGAPYTYPGGADGHIITKIYI